MKNQRRSIRRPTAKPVDTLEPRRLFAVTAPSFAPLANVSVGGSLVAVAAGDFNGDGKADLAVADQTGGDVRILYGSGTGAFTTGPVLPVGGKPTDLVATDLTGDGVTDLLVGVVTSTSAEVVAFVGGSNGVPGAAQPIVVNSADSTDVLHVAVGDFNKDGHPDVAVADYTAADVFVLTGDGDGTFTSAGTYSTVSSPDAIAVGDYNADGNLDIAVTGTATGNGLPQSEIVIFTGAATGQFGFGTELSGGNSSADALASIDVTADGRPDLIVGTGDSTATVLGNSQNLAFTVLQNISLPATPLAIAGGDFNFDGITDAATANSLTNDVSVLTNDGTGGAFTPATFSAGTEPAGIAVADLNDDGKPDIVTANAGDGTVSVLLNTTAGTVAQATTTTLISSANPVDADSALAITATVAAAGTVLSTGTGLPTGTVNFFDGTKFIGSATIAAGTDTATLTTPTLAVGSHSITATYVTDTIFAASTSAALVQAIGATATNGPDLIGTAVSSTLPAEIVAGESAVLRVKVTNQGNAAAAASIVNSVFLSSSGVVDSGSIAFAVKGKLAGGNLMLKPGQSKILTGTVIVPAGVTPGSYTVLVALNTTGSLSESDSTNDVAALAAPVTAVNAFGAVGGRARVPLTLTTAVGTATLKLSGPGTGAVTIDAGGGLAVSLSATSAGSTLTVTPEAKSAVALSSLDDSGVLNAIVAPAATLTGDLTLGGVKRISLGSVDSAAWTITGNVSQITIAAATNSAMRLAISGGVNRFVDRGTLTGTVAAANFGSVLIQGDATAVDLYAGANLVTGVAAVGSIKSLRVVGATTESLFAAGLSTLPGTGGLHPGVTTTAPLAGGSIKTITFGLLDADSRIVAATLPVFARVDGQRIQISGDSQFISG